ncbi:MAG: uroporphyrinogen-III synthase [Gemmatimonadales bacterium]|jgi:uroporphyrinogen-III synthase
MSAASDERPGIAVTRPGDSPGRLGDLLREAGARVVHWPCIRFEPPEDPEPLTAAAGDATADWIAITSPRAAHSWLDAASDRAHRTPAAVVGPATAAVLEAAGWPVGRVAGERSAGGLLAAFAAAGDAAGARIIFPCSDRASDELADGLRRLGAEVVRVTAYRTVTSAPSPEDVLAAARSGRVAVVTFASPSAVEGFLARADADRRREITARLAAAAIGPTTGAALAAAGWRASVADDASLEALASAALRAADARTANSLDPRVT